MPTSVAPAEWLMRQRDSKASGMLKTARLAAVEILVLRLRLLRFTFIETVFLAFCRGSNVRERGRSSASGKTLPLPSNGWGPDEGGNEGGSDLNGAVVGAGAFARRRP